MEDDIDNIQDEVNRVICSYINLNKLNSKLAGRLDKVIIEFKSLGAMDSKLILYLKRYLPYHLQN